MQPKPRFPKMNKLPKYLCRARNHWRYQRRVPTRLIPVVGVRWWKKYLNTSDLATATERARLLRFEHDTLIAAFDRLSKKDKAEIANAGGLKKLQQQAKIIAHSIPFLQVAANIEVDVNHESGGQYPDHMVVEHATFKQESTQEVTAAITELATVEGLLTRVGVNNASHGVPTPAKRTPAKDTVQGWFPIWRQLKPTTDEHAVKVKVALRRFTEAVGELKLIDVRREHVRTFAGLCAKVPVIQRLPPSQRTATIHELVRMAKAANLTLVKHGSAEKHLHHLRGYLQVARNEGEIEVNPADGVKIPKPIRSYAEKKESKKKPFTGVQSKHILSMLLKDRPDRPDYYWIMKLGIYHGFRIEEIVQLKKSDIYEEDGHPVVSIHDLEDNRVKNEPSVRDVAVHPKIAADFKRYISTVPGDMVFPNVRSYHGRKSHNVGKALNRFIRGTCGITDTRLTYNSTRHAFIDACCAAEPPRRVELHLCGRSPEENKAHGKYGEGPSIKQQVKWLKKIDPLK